MKKEILEQYVDACELIKETEAEIKALKRKKNVITQDSVRGSNPEWPYEQKHFKVTGISSGASDDDKLKRKEELLEKRKSRAEELKCSVEEWMATIPQRMQRIIQYRIFEGMTWQQVAAKIGRKATKDSVRMEFDNFLKN